MKTDPPTFKRPRSSTTTSSNNQNLEENKQIQTKPKQKKIKNVGNTKES